MLEALDQLHFYGNNGWTRGFGQDQACRRLERMRGIGLLHRDVILGDMLARGHHADAIKRLGELRPKSGEP